MECFGHRLDPNSVRKPNLLTNDEIPQPQSNNNFLKFMQTSRIEFSQDPNIRLRHAHGQTQVNLEELFMRFHLRRKCGKSNMGSEERNIGGSPI